MKQAIGVDIGGGTIRSALVNEKGKAVKFRIVETEAGKGKKRIMKNLIQAISLVFPENKKIAGIGIGFAGAVNPKKGIVVQSPHISSMNKVNIVKEVGKKFRLPVFLENDANVFALGEAVYGAGKKYNIIVGLTFGTGIGGGMVIEKKVYEGSSNIFEVGHMSINFLGPKCPCGGSGCWEEYVSIRAIMRRTEALIEGRNSLLHKMWPLSPKKIDEAEARGDKVAREILKETGYYFGVGLANLVNVLNPDAIIVGGGIGKSKVIVKEGINVMKKRSFKQAWKKVKVIKSKFKNRAGVIGGAALVFSKRGARK
ncbi:MAG: ROK family protein [archaeon]